MLTLIYSGVDVHFNHFLTFSVFSTCCKMYSTLVFQDQYLHTLHSPFSIPKGKGEGFEGVEGKEKKLSTFITLCDLYYCLMFSYYTTKVPNLQ